MLTELENYRQRLDNLRGQIKALVVDLPAEALNWRPLEDGDDHAVNSLAVLAAHVAGSERFWLGEVIARRPPSRDREAEFRTETTDPAELVRLLEQTGAETRAILATLHSGELDRTRQIEERTVPVRWILLHVIDHTTLHLGHMQLTYQLWHGGQAAQAPRWFQRLPENKL